MDDRYDWSRLNHLQLCRYAEYFTKMEFTLNLSRKNLPLLV